MPSNRMTLLDSAARTASGSAVVTGGTFTRFSRVTLLLDVTAAATAAGDTLDVYVQKQVGPGPHWHDFVHFTQVLGDGGAKQFVATVTADDVTTGLGALQDAALAAGVEGGPWSDQWRIRWVVADADTPSFTFAVYGVFS